jgi:hypothetical protein
MTGGFFHGKGLQKGIIVISNPTSLLDRRDVWLTKGYFYILDNLCG